MEPRSRAPRPAPLSARRPPPAGPMERAAPRRVPLPLLLLGGLALLAARGRGAPSPRPPLWWLPSLPRTPRKTWSWSRSGSLGAAPPAAVLGSCALAVPSPHPTPGSGLNHLDDLGYLF